MLCRNHVDVAEGVRRCSRCGTPFCPDCLVTIHGRDYCSVCKTEQLLDVRSGTSTETLPFAPMGRRLAAQMVDNFLLVFAAILLIVPMSISGMFEGSNGDTAAMLIIPIVLFALFGYEGIMLSRNGQTFGKMLLKIRVVRADGGPISTGQAWGRSFARRIAEFTISFINVVPALVSKERTCVHDLLARTRVVNAE